MKTEDKNKAIAVKKQPDLNDELIRTMYQVAIIPALPHIQRAKKKEVAR